MNKHDLGLINKHKIKICCFAFVAWSLALGFLSIAYALDLDKLKMNLLSAYYSAAIKEGERTLALSGASSENLDELYYFLGLSYLKSGNYLRSADIFEIILKELKNSPFKNLALMGLGDAYYLKGDYAAAINKYKESLTIKNSDELLPALYYRLSQASFKQGQTQQAREYVNSLKKDFPHSLEAKLNQELFPASALAVKLEPDFYYAVQVGSFSSKINAGNLVKKLQGHGYSAYMEDGVSSNNSYYRVRIGKFKTRLEAQDMEKKLSKQGYPTKIIP
ncbi:MAG: SPOR domain-containing protein [Candidatus Omnitrophota bacterium]|nr:SPOR domain-containing protein [Candidatus Omnitrophota bacterium]MBU1929815.1 SPOR domain-containing protein [Candidatus Omnitrophota bacterium]MBU2035183.1 SPOR domain-containing protein [Candidatus Omnitrophota bacterium]MBU2221339.1 SPOR domain-containing protein [Candidatus Omnitrophota bacterium]MBU2258651.1 SPOR domain-containing protein [Candidatus Omnitrophota bacterium]